MSHNALTHVAHTGSELAKARPDAAAPTQKENTKHDSRLKTTKRQTRDSRFNGWKFSRDFQFFNGWEFAGTDSHCMLNKLRVTGYMNERHRLPVQEMYRGSDLIINQRLSIQPATGHISYNTCS